MPDTTDIAAIADAAYGRRDMTVAVAAYEQLDPARLTAVQWLHFAHALALTGDLARAVQMATDHIARFGGTAPAFVIVAHAALESGDFGRALSHAAVAERLEPDGPGADLAYDALCRLGALPEAMAVMHRMTMRLETPSFPRVNDLCAVHGLVDEAAAIPGLLAALPPPDAPRGMPGLLVAMPKSGGATIAGSIAALCGAAFTGIGADLPDWAGFPAPWLHPELLDYFDGRQVLLLSHAAAIAQNQGSLARFPLPIVVHLRDPRDALVSLFAMGETLGALQFLRFVRCRPDYALLSPEERLAALHDRVYPLYLRWIDGWLRFAEREPGLVTFSTYEAFLDAPEALVTRLARRYGAAVDAAPASLQSMHFRQGRSGSHREVFTAAQSRAMFDALPAAAGQRFRWRP